MKEKNLDLRLVIGLFLALVGILLIGAHFFVANAKDAASAVNLYTGFVFIAVGAFLGIPALKK